MLFPDEFSDAEVRRAWDYYVQYTTHDSSLSAGVHAIIASRLGLDDDAWRYWRSSASLDLDALSGGAAEGVHAACAAANWLILVHGFGGVKSALQSESLSLSPRLPAKWSRLAFPLVWRGVNTHIDIHREFTIISNRSDQEVAADVWGERRLVAPNSAESWKAKT
jgi:trehalose/maltose hydrolase-like predicted phosphorylase